MNRRFSRRFKKVHIFAGSVPFTGDLKRPQADPDGVKAFAKSFMSAFKDHPASNAYKNLGTPMLVKMTYTAGVFPNRYW